MARRRRETAKARLRGLHAPSTRSAVSVLVQRHKTTAKIIPRKQRATPATSAVFVLVQRHKTTAKIIPRKQQEQRRVTATRWRKESRSPRGGPSLSKGNQSRRPPAGRSQEGELGLHQEEDDTGTARRRREQTKKRLRLGDRQGDQERGRKAEQKQPTQTSQGENKHNKRRTRKDNVEDRGEDTSDDPRKEERESSPVQTKPNSKRKRRSRTHERERSVARRSDDRNVGMGRRSTRVPVVSYQQPSVNAVRRKDADHVHVSRGAGVNVGTCRGRRTKSGVAGILRAVGTNRNSTRITSDNVNPSALSEKTRATAATARGRKTAGSSGRVATRRRKKRKHRREKRRKRSRRRTTEEDRDDRQTGQRKARSGDNQEEGDRRALQKPKRDHTPPTYELQSIDFRLQQKGISELQETKQQHEQKTERDTNSEPWQGKGGSPDWGSSIAPSHSEGPRRLQEDGAHPSSKERSNSEGVSSEIRHLQRNGCTKGETLTSSRGKEGKSRITTAEEEARTGARADEELPDAVMSPARQRKTAAGHKGDSNKGENREERTIPTRRRRRHEHSKVRQQCGKITYLTWAGRLLTLGVTQKCKQGKYRTALRKPKGTTTRGWKPGRKKLRKETSRKSTARQPWKQKTKDSKKQGSKEQRKTGTRARKKRGTQRTSAADGGKTGKRRERGKKQKTGEEGKGKDKVELTVKSAPRRPRGAGAGAGEGGTAKRAVDTTSKELSSEAEAGRALLGGEKRSSRKSIADRRGQTAKKKKGRPKRRKKEAGQPPRKAKKGQAPRGRRSVRGHHEGKREGRKKEPERKTTQTPNSKGKKNGWNKERERRTNQQRAAKGEAARGSRRKQRRQGRGKQTPEREAQGGRPKRTTKQKEKKKNELFLNAAKCEIATQKATYLGFVIEPGRVSPDPKKVETIKNWPEVLRNRKQLRGFLGMVGFYRRLIPNFNKTAHPLHQLLKEDSDMTWGPRHSQAVHELKKKLMDATNVHIFDPEEPITINTEASKHAVGAVLGQNGYPIAFESKKMGTRDKFLPAYESELLAIVYALTKWKSFIGSKLVTVETDHATLSRMLTQKQVTSRLGYWLDKLAEFNIKIVYKPGKQT
ncbi:retrotransposon nucleocapsid protein [Cystoisospora suis]|uniref:Retrotransposon nucleocapsid protein n=1 Tax=Cystoisospora suis TaxID=483139 RepID=A0A2C6KTV7_9APIC|nr:retrotransposon nucleocapsid protein [Cystoisospora suis]